MFKTEPEVFSIEELDFGLVEKGGCSRKMVVLHNNSPEQKLKFEFQRTGLMCADEINVVPISGEIEPNSHRNVKMTLTAGRIPSYFEGEIQCMIDWEDGGGERSVQTHSLEGEYLFLRLKKRSQF